MFKKLAIVLFLVFVFLKFPFWAFIVTLGGWLCYKQYREEKGTGGFSTAGALGEVLFGGGPVVTGIIAGAFLLLARLGLPIWAWLISMVVMGTYLGYRAKVVRD